MATVAFTPTLERHVERPTRVVGGAPSAPCSTPCSRRTRACAASTTGNVFASTDRGQRWSAVSHHLPPVHAVTFTD